MTARTRENTGIIYHLGNTDRYKPLKILLHLNKNDYSKKEFRGQTAMYAKALATKSDNLS